MKKFKQNFTPTIFNAKLREINVFQITLFSRNISYCMWEKYCLKVINSTWLSTDCWEIVYISPSSEKGAKLQMAIQNAISSKEVKICLATKYSFKIEKNSSITVWNGHFSETYLDTFVLIKRPAALRLWPLLSLTFFQS